MRTFTFIFCLCTTLNAQNETTDIAKADLTERKVKYDSLDTAYITKVAALNKVEATDKKKRKKLTQDLYNQAAVINDFIHRLSIDKRYYIHKEVPTKMMDSIFMTPTYKTVTGDIPPQPKYAQRFYLYKSLRDGLLRDDYNFREDGNYTDGSRAIVVQQQTFDTRINEVLNQVVFGNDELVNNATAFGFTQTNEKTSLSSNLNFKTAKLNTKFIDFLKIGLSAEGKGTDFNLYSKNSWSKKTSFSVGVLIIPRFSALSITKTYTNQSFEADHTGRKLTTDKTLKRLKAYDNIGHKSLQDLKNSLINVEDADAIKTKFTYLKAIEPTLLALITKGDYVKAVKKVDSIVNEIETFNTMYYNSDEYKKYIRKEFSNYEKAYSPLSGNYTTRWVDAGLKVSNSNYTFTDETIDSSLSIPYTGEREYNEVSFEGTLNGNYTLHLDQYVLYIQLGTSVHIGSFLDSNIIQGTPNINFLQNDIFFIRDENENILGTTNTIDKTLAYADIHFYGAMFFTKLKNFGFNLNLRHNYLINRPEATDYTNNFTAVGGPVFRTIKGDASGATFGLDFGWENADYKGKLDDYFIARIRIGIPFNIYSKKAKDKKTK